MLTIIQKENIALLRKAGYSYSNISVLVNAPADTIKKHCKRHGIMPSENIKKQPIVSCQCCGRMMIQKTKRAKTYCSDYCRIKMWRKKDLTETLKNNNNSAGLFSHEEGLMGCPEKTGIT